MNYPSVTMSSIEQITSGIAGIDIPNSPPLSNMAPAIPEVSAQVFLDNLPLYRPQEHKEECMTIFDEIKQSGAHGGKWPSTTWGILELPYSNMTLILSNDLNQHMEYFAMSAIFADIDREKNYLQKNQKHGPVIIKLYTNYSPCWGCAQALINFKQALFSLKKCDLNLEIIAAAPYNCYRTSCLKCQNLFYKEYKFQEFSNNTYGLQKLKENLISVRAFGYQDWKKLAKNLSLKKGYYTELKYGSEKLGKKAAHEILHTRLEADLFAHRDFIFIFENDMARVI